MKRPQNGHANDELPEIREFFKKGCSKNDAKSSQCNS